MQLNLRLNKLFEHIQTCLYCKDYAVARVGIDVDLHNDGNIKSGYVYLCNKHIKYIDIMGSMKDMSCFTSCLKELR